MYPKVGVKLLLSFWRVINLLELHKNLEGIAPLTELLLVLYTKYKFPLDEREHKCCIDIFLLLRVVPSSKAQRSGLTLSECQNIVLSKFFKIDPILLVAER